MGCFLNKTMKPLGEFVLIILNHQVLEAFEPFEPFEASTSPGNPDLY